MPSLFNQCNQIANTCSTGRFSQALQILHPLFSQNSVIERNFGDREDIRGTLNVTHETNTNGERNITVLEGDKYKKASIHDLKTSGHTYIVHTAFVLLFLAFAMTF